MPFNLVKNIPVGDPAHARCLAIGRVWYVRSSPGLRLTAGDVAFVVSFRRKERWTISFRTPKVARTIFVTFSGSARAAILRSLA